MKRCALLVCVLVSFGFAARPTGLELDLAVSGTNVFVLFQGEPAFNYELQHSTNLSDWLGLSSTNPVTPGLVRMVDVFDASAGVAHAFRLSADPATPDFGLVGFAALDGFASNNTLRVGGTTGGAGGPTVIASNLAWLVNYAQRSNMPLNILITSDIDLSPLNNNNSAPGYPAGRINVNSDKTVYSTNGATLRRGTLSISGKQNIVIRDLYFRDLWVYDPSGAYDIYGWDYIGIGGGSHHIWVDHCDFDRVYDGMIDITHGADYVTVSWNVFRNQKKCNLVGNSDSTGDEDRGHLNVTFHHNYYAGINERTPRMRFGNAHVFNLYFDNRDGTNTAGRCIQSTTEAATLVENVYFTHATNAYPSVYANGGPTGACLRVIGSIITNSPGNKGFQEWNADTFSFNPPWPTNRPPYSYPLDPVEKVPQIVTNWAGVRRVR